MDKEKKALEELKQLIREAINRQELTAIIPSKKRREKAITEKNEEEKRAAAETLEESQVQVSEEVQTEEPALVEVKEEENTPEILEKGGAAAETLEESQVQVYEEVETEEPEILEKGAVAGTLEESQVQVSEEVQTEEPEILEKGAVAGTLEESQVQVSEEVETEEPVLLEVKEGENTPEILEKGAAAETLEESQVQVFEEIQTEEPEILEKGAVAETLEESQVQVSEEVQTKEPALVEVKEEENTPEILEKGAAAETLEESQVQVSEEVQTKESEILEKAAVAETLEESQVQVSEEVQTEEPTLVEVKEEENTPPGAAAETLEESQVQVSEEVQTEEPALVEVKEEENTPPAQTEILEKGTILESTVAVSGGPSTEIQEVPFESIVDSSVVVAARPSTEIQEEDASQLVESKEVESRELRLEEEEVSIWGIPLLADQRSDVILLKFLRARDFQVNDAFTMIKSTLQWRKEFEVEDLLEEEFGNQWKNHVFMRGFDREGHPICYNVCGEFHNKEFYYNTLGTMKRRDKFLRWRVQLMEKNIRNLDFSPNGICSMVQVNDLKKSSSLVADIMELEEVSNQACKLLQDNYPGFIAKQVCINVPKWYLDLRKMINLFLPRRLKNDFVFAGLSKSGKTLFKYIAPEQVPVQYGGLSNENEEDFTIDDAVTEDTIKPATKHIIEFPITERCHLVWELVVRHRGKFIYKAEFVHNNGEYEYTVSSRRKMKIGRGDEGVMIRDSFISKTGESGKVVLTIDNQKKKKQILHRYKMEPYRD